MWIYVIGLVLFACVTLCLWKVLEIIKTAVNSKFIEVFDVQLEQIDINGNTQTQSSDSIDSDSDMMKSDPEFGDSDS